MTTLTIIPNWKNKTARFKGTVAAGEHVAVTIQNDNGEGGKVITDASTLRLRVIGFDGRTLAIFPEPVPEGETPEAWGEEDLTPLTCTLNLNTVQMLRAVPPAANVPLLFVLDDYENKTLYFKEQFPVEHWPRLRGEEEPTDLDNYKDLIAEFNARLDGFGSRITDAEAVANAATTNASAAVASANNAIATANNAVGIAQDAKSGAKDSAEAAMNSALAAEKAQALAEAAAESINNPDATLTEEGVAADAKATGDKIAAEENRAQTAERDLRADVSSAQTAIANRYTKSEVDAKIAAVQTFQKYLVQTLPDSEAADYKGLYLVPTGETSPDGDLCEEWMVVGEVGSRRWEKIGGTAVDLGNYYTKSETDAALASKVPTSRTINGKALTDNVSLSGADIPVSGSDQTKIDAALAAKLGNTGAQTLTGSFEVSDANSSVIVHPDKIQVVNSKTPPRSYNLRFPGARVGNGVFATTQNIASDFDEGTTYHEGDLVMYEGLLFRCIVDSHIGVWNDLNFEDVDVGTVLFGKAYSADLRYRIADAVVRKTLPADCFPVTFTYEGVAYSVNSLVEESEASAAGDMYIESNGDSYSLVMILTPETESEKALALEVAYLDVDGVFESSGLQDLRFGGVAPVADASPTLANIQVLADRAVNLITATDETGIDIELPAAVQGRVRDFTVRLTLTTTTSISFIPITGETITWDSSGDPSGTFQAGTHLLRLTEVAPGVFHVGGIAAGNLITIVTLSDSTETMAAILARLNAINAARQHVFFDCSGIDVNPRLYLCTIMIDADANAVRVYDQVTGKLYIGPYDATETIGEVFAKAVDAYHSITVSAVTLDGVTVTGQTVTIREGTDATAPVYATATITDGAPVVFVVPKGMIYFLEITDALPDHFGPRVTSGARQGIATADAAVTFTYYDAEHIDTSEITTFAKLQEALTWFGTNEAAARNNLVGLEIPDTWTATNGTVYDNPRVVWDVHYFEDENGVRHLAALMGTKYCSSNDVQFDAAEGEECDSATETVAEADVYYYGLALGETSKTAANLTLLELSTGTALPYADYAKIYKSAIRDTTRSSLQYGYNNWRDSAYRQYLNSDAETGQWWGATHIGDVAPSQLNSVRGFMAGCSAALLAAAKKVKVATWPNSVTDGPNQITTLYETLDTFFLPSGSEVYGNVNESGGASVEGELSPYWQARTGYTAPNNAAISTRIIYRELPVGSTANRSAAYVRLRSANRGSSYFVWVVSTSGQVSSGYYASFASASVPACVIY